MGMVMIKCPTTGQAVETGIAMDKQSFERKNITNNSVICPACGKKHTWSKKDAWVQE